MIYTFWLASIKKIIPARNMDIQDNLINLEISGGGGGGIFILINK